MLRGEAPWSDEEDPRDPGPGPAESARRLELRRALERALNSLSDRERTIFVLKEIEGLASREVARVLGITTVTVRRHLSRARRRLRLVLGESAKKNPIPIERIAPDGSSHQ